MTALQELANVKGELERIKADSDLNAKQFTDAQNALAEVTATRDALAAEKVALIAERDALAAKVATLEKASHDFNVSVETRAAAIATETLAAIGAQPLKTADAAKATEQNLAQLAADIRAERDPAKRASLFAKLQSLWSKTQ